MTLERDPAGSHEIVGRVAQFVVREPLPIRVIGDLGLVAETEERFATAQRDRDAHGLFDFPERVGLGFWGGWQFREGAVGTAVAAEVRQRDEYVPRNADDVALAPPLALGGAFEHDFPNDRVAKLRGEPLGGAALELARIDRAADDLLRFSAGQ